MSLLKSRIRNTRIFCVLLIPLIVITAPQWRENTLIHELLEFTGHWLVAAGVLLRVFAAVYIAGQKNAMIASSGPFSVVRNPLYVGTFIASLGLAMMTAIMTVVAIVAMAFCIYYRLTVRGEEAFLQNKFGDAYHAYTERVPRWWPALNLWTEPTQLVTKPYFVRQATLDAAVFLLILPLFEVLCELREGGLVPTYLVLP